MIIFEDNQDHYVFLNYLIRSARKNEVSIVAYCLMSNHFHLIIKDDKENVSTFVLSLSTSYVRYFNAKYHRSGALFEGRYQSRSIANEDYLLTVFRYVLRNPEVAKLCKTSDYKWSSYQEYFEPKVKKEICDKTLIMNFVPNIKILKDYINQSVEDKSASEIEVYKGLPFNEALKLSNKILGELNCINIQALKKEPRDMAIRLLLSAGISFKQVMKITGLSKSIVYRAKQTRFNFTKM